MRLAGHTFLLLGLLLTPSLARASESTAARGVASPAVVDERTPVAVPEPSALALRYYRTGNALWVFDEVWALAVPSLLLFTGLSSRLRDLARRIGRSRFLTFLIYAGLYTLPAPALLPSAGLSSRLRDLARRVGASWFLTIAIYSALYTVIVFVVDLPLHYYQGFVRQHAYGLSNQTIGKWFGNSLIRVGIAAAVGFGFTWVPYLLLDRRPRRWWLDTTILTVPFLVAIVFLTPILVDPLFNHFGSMKDKALEIRIRALAGRAGIEKSRIFEVDKSVDTKAMNAYVTGVVGTRRIVLWDTLLAKLNDEEVLAVVGHEMGHYVLGHIPRSIALSTLITLAGLFWVDRAGRVLIGRFHRHFGFDRLSDVASVPLLFLLMGVASLVLGPIGYAYSRFQEHEADCFALELTRANHSAATAFATLQRENLSNPRPGMLYTLWRSTHPSIAERIEFCNTYHPWRDGRPLRYADRFRE